MNRTVWTAYALAGLVVIAVTVLAALGVPIPELLTAIGLTAAGAGGGAMIPARAQPSLPSRSDVSSIEGRHETPREPS